VSAGARGVVDSASNDGAGPVEILAISGSLRGASINSALLRATARLASGDLRVRVFDGVAALPLFNPDVVDADTDTPPPAPVRYLYDAVTACDALLIASPEYAHGVTGAIKNLLDWLVSFKPFVYLPVAVVNTSPRAHHADAALRETLKTMSALIVEPASLSIPLLGTGLDEDGMVRTAAIADAIGRSVAALGAAARDRRGPPAQAPLP
jgi:NAD(P)H-dependent FMN reductase